MARCDDCMKKPVHPDKKCCFNCARVAADCEVWHNCGEDCPGWEEKQVARIEKAVPRRKSYVYRCSVCNGEFYFCGMNPNYEYCPRCGRPFEKEAAND